MKIELKKLEIKNFKGLKSLAVDFGSHTVISGRNATGKTSVYDAYMWLLFDMDSSGSHDFSLKPLDETGEARHGLETAVKGIFQMGDDSLTLQKVYKEKWTKKRGSTLKEFTGHTTDYYVDEVPVKKKDYEDRIADLENFDIFKILSDPFYFAERIPWKARRDALVALAGDISFHDVAGDSRKFSDLEPLLEKHTIEEILKIKKGSLKEINDRLKEIPVRIDEVGSSIAASVERYSKEDLAKVEEEITSIKERRSTSEYEKALKALGDTVSEAATAYSKRRMDLQKQWSDKVSALEAEARNLEREATEVIQLEDSLKSKASTLNARIEESSDKVSDIKSQIKAVIKEEKEVETVCFNCGQPLPEGMVANQKKAYQDDKIKRLSKLKDTAEALKNQIKSDKEEVTRLAEQVEKAHVEAVRLRDELDKKRSEAEKEKKCNPDLSPELVELKAREEEARAAYDAKLKKGDSGPQEQLDALYKRLMEIKSSLKEQEEISEKRRRIDELKQEEKSLAAEYETAERIVVLCEEYSRALSNKVTERVQEHFQGVQWKLFDEQINGGVKDICEATINGVPFQDANNGAKINAGLSIINTLSGFYDLSVPVFVDNSESVNRLTDTKGQLIELRVTEDKELKVEGR